MAGQSVRFLIAGGVVCVVYLATTTGLADLAGVPFQIALPIGYALATALHFALQRRFVWRNADGFALPLHHQVLRYVLVAASVYGLTAASTALLPSALGLPTDLVFVATVAAVSTTNFLVLRHRVFHP